LLIGEHLAAPGRFQGEDLPVEQLATGRHPAIADQLTERSRFGLEQVWEAAWQGRKGCHAHDCTRKGQPIVVGHTDCATCFRHRSLGVSA
jgi:hypothetical protein